MLNQFKLNWDCVLISKVSWINSLIKYSFGASSRSTNAKSVLFKANSIKLTNAFLLWSSDCMIFLLKFLYLFWYRTSNQIFYWVPGHMPRSFPPNFGPEYIKHDLFPGLKIFLKPISSNLVV